MIGQVQRDDPRLGAIAGALGPYAWQRLDAEMLARHIIGALDRWWVTRELGPAGLASEGAGDVEPAPRDDERVTAVAHGLRGCPRRSLTLEAVGRQALSALDAWRHRRAWLDVELAWLLDEG